MRPLPIVWLSTLAMATVGCFETNTEITLGADGSGSQTMRLALSGQALATLRGAAAAVEASTTRSDPLDVFDVNKVRAELEAAGLALVAHRTSDNADRRTVDLQVRFADLAILARNPLSGGARATWQVSRGAGRDEVRLVYFPQGEEAWKAARQKARDLAQEPDDTVQHFITSRLRQIAGLDVTLALQLPGDIIAHTANLQLEGKRKVIAKIKASDIRTSTDLLVRLAPRYEVLFACPGFPCPDLPVDASQHKATAPASATEPTRR